MDIKITGKYIIFTIESDSRPITHEVIYNRETQEWSCTCEDYIYRKRCCKHTRKAIEFLEDLFRETLHGQNVYTGETLTAKQITMEA